MTKDKELLSAAVNAAATLSAVYQWVDRVEKAGGATCLSGIAECNAMLKSLRKNAPRVQTSILDPLNAAIKAGQK